MRPPRPRRSHRWLFAGCLVLVALFALMLALLGWAGFRYAEHKVGGTQPPPGDARRFDPVAHYAEIARYAGGAVQLVRLQARFVRRDGTLDLKADYRPAPTATYVFQRATTAPVHAAPLGAGGPADGTKRSRWT